MDDTNQSQAEVPRGESHVHESAARAVQPHIPSPPLDRDSNVPFRRVRAAWAWIAAVIGLLIAGCVAVPIIGSFLVRSVVDSSMDQVFSIMGVDESILQADPSSAPAAFYYALGEQNYDVAQSLLAPELARTYTPSELRRRWEALENARGNITFELQFNSLVENGTSASITVSLVPSRGDHFDVNLSIEKLAGSWKITTGEPDIIPEP